MAIVNPVVDALLEILIETIKTILKANSAAEAEEEALFTAQAKIARLRAERKFGKAP